MRLFSSTASPEPPEPPASAPAPAEDDPIAIVKPPWTLVGDFYVLCHWIPGSQAANLPAIAHSPLEAAALYGDASACRPVGGIGMIQVIRYHQSPVGPYDELALMPGKFEWSKDAPGGPPVSGQDFKITRIYVSQKHTCYNGRANWNIPKHLARFEWDHHPDKSVTVRVYPHDTTADESETHASSTPFFQATMKSVPYMPAMPFSSNWLKYLGMDSKAVLPPLPQGNGSRGELPGTDRWRTIYPVISGNDAAVITIDLSQRDEKGDVIGDHENFWPGLGRWHVGMKMTDATMTIGPAEDMC